jgi:hypothetical protein
MNIKYRHLYFNLANNGWIVSTWKLVRWSVWATRENITKSRTKNIRNKSKIKIIE